LPAGAGALFFFCICCFFFATYFVPGILAVYWTPSPRTSAQAATVGALSGVLATGLDSLATLLLALGISMAGLNERYIEQLMPNAQTIIQQSGTSFWFSTTGTLLQTGISLVFHVILGVILSTLGAILYTAIKKE
jgi:type II secretory pathway component PulF